jgi:UDP-3-O-[3-hydroxymyristoyl] N-acetylglucosamine deacetylase / 3-hydroxyacyl-[acyl-carrier-protein] dehydratase
MSVNQRTIKQPVTVSGVGLHTGETVNLTFHPASENHGYVFRRTDLEGQPMVPALVDHVVDTSRGTTLALNGAKVHTVEHTLAALAGLEIDNVLIDLDGPEPPIMDGSAYAFTQALQNAGILEQQAVREYFVIDEPVHHLEPDRSVEIVGLPSRNFHATVMIDFGSQVLRAQHATLTDITQFPQAFANCRTFVFLHEVEALYKAGLIKGGNLESALVIVDREISEEELVRLRELFQMPNIAVEEGMLNGKSLHYDNEPARHKLLDLVGDLALVGMPIKGHIMASRPGHKANIEMARKLRAKVKQNRIANRFQKEKKKGIIFDIKAIQDILPHRYPFLLVDKIIDFTERTIVGVKNVTFNEPFFQGHFPGNPIMPGVLQVEAMGQVGGILLLNTIENPQSIWVYFVAFDNVRFKKPVIPGDTLTLELEMTALRRSICKMSGKAFVDGELVCSADLVASVVPKTKL